MSYDVGDGGVRKCTPLSELPCSESLRLVDSDGGDAVALGAHSGKSDPGEFVTEKP